MLVENAILTVQIAGNEDYLHLVFGTVAHTEVLQHVQHLVVRHVVQPVRDERYFQRSGIMLVFLFQTLLQVFAGGTHPTGYVDESQHFLIQILITVQTVQ